MLDEGKPKYSALVVDDEESSSLILSSILQSCGFSTRVAYQKSQMNQEIQEKKFDFLFLDYKLGSDNGLNILQDTIKEFPAIKIIMITAFGSIELALDAMHLGASGFITKPFDEEKVEKEIARALRLSMSQYSTVKTDSKHPSGIIGISPAVKRIHAQIEKMKDVPTTVLINGESGTGKELIARALHDLGIRAREKFEAINCAAIPETLLEAEMFGYKRGAFTDAKQDRKGLFETCSQGTLFLDEIGDLPLALQTKLLRVLQEKVITPLGSSQSIKVNTRVITATNRNLHWLSKEGRFRKDLYYRLSILQLESPPLRDRVEDIAELTRYFIEQISTNLKKNIQSPTAEVMARIESYDWPGNIRELQNSLERAIVLSDEGTISLDDLFLPENNKEAEDIFVDISCIRDLSSAKEEFEKKYLEKLLRATKGNVSQASRVAGRIRTDMYRLFAKYSLNPNDFKL